MPYDGEEPPLVEVDPALNELSHKIIGAAMEVHRRLGAGLDESLYQKAMCIELRFRGLQFSREVRVQVEYRGEAIGDKRLDLVVEGLVVVELKAIEQLAPVHSAQLLTYLKITKLQLGLLINFNVPILKGAIRRVINT